MRHPQWSYSAVLYEMNIRQLTAEGTLLAAAEQLPRLKQMGVDAIWLMPVYPIGEVSRKGTMGSYYSVADYCGINEQIGTFEDFDLFVATAHSLGLKVILDWVANHTSRDAKWLTEKPLDWYKRDENGEALVPWDWSDTAQLNYDNREVWQGQIDAMKFWVTEHNIDGFRCDMAMLVPTPFWNYAAEELRRVKEDLFMLCEAEQRDLTEQAFNAHYGWQMHHLMNDLAQGKCRVTALRDYLYRDREEYPATTLRLSFTSNHDENSWSGSEFQRMGEAHEALSLFTFVAPRAMPLIYTGQEIGYDHVFAFFDRDPIRKYTFNEHTERYAKLARLHRENNALWGGAGNWVEIHNNAEDCLLILVRETAENRVVAVMNLSPYTIQAEYNTGIYAGRYTDFMADAPYELPSHVCEIMAPWAYRVLTLKK